MARVSFKWWRGFAVARDGELTLFRPEPYEFPLWEPGDDPAYLAFARLRPGDEQAAAAFASRWGLLGVERTGPGRFVGRTLHGWTTVLVRTPWSGIPDDEWRWPDSDVVEIGWSEVSPGVEKLAHWWKAAQEMSQAVEALLAGQVESGSQLDAALATVEDRLFPSQVRLQRVRGVWATVPEPLTLLQALYVQLVVHLQEGRRVGRCPRCSRWFVIRDPRQRYCSDSCRWATQKRRQRRRKREGA